MNTLERHIEWTSPAVLWDHFNGPTSAAERRIFRTPALLRFASDSIMDEFLALMKADPRRLSELLAVPETWKAPAATAPPPTLRGGLAGKLQAARTVALRKLEARRAPRRSEPWNTVAEPKPLKLYQPAHQRYYLVASCLVCRTLGLPDRPLDTSAEERATFVIRRLRPRAGAAAVNPDPASCDELAFVGGVWKEAGDPASLVEGEETYPLSPLAYSELDGRRRRLFNGLIPVAKRETLVGAALAASPGPGPSAPTPIDTRQMLLKMQVLEPWANLDEIAKLAQKASERATDDEVPAAAIPATLARANEQIQAIAWYVLLDLSHWLEDNIAPLWEAIGAGSSAGLSGVALAAYNALGSYSSGGHTLRAALRQIRTFEPTLESVKSVYRASTAAEWPSLRFPLVTATLGGPAGLLKPARQDLESRLVAALPSGGASPVPPRAVAQIGGMDFASPWFTVRCVFERPQCAALSPPVVSDASASFQLASFFDPDAPARPIRIAMPVDTTPAGLRKFDKNTAFVLSDVLCGQVSAIRSLTFGDLIMAVLPWPLHKDLGIGDMKPCGTPGDPSGMACSLSIPILTICALILLMIIVKLLDLVFFWSPFFQICLPVPKFDAKENA